MIFKKPNGVWAIDFTDKRVGRVALSARTTKKAEANRREAILRALVDQGEHEIVRRVGKGLHIAAVQAAVEAGDLSAIRGRNGGARHDLGASIDRYLDDVQGSREKGTWEAYRAILRDLERGLGVARDEFGGIVADVPMHPITSDRLTEWLREPKATNENLPWAPRRQKVARAVIGKLWKRELARSVEWADVNGGAPGLTRNPVASTDAPRIRQTRVEFLRPAEWRTLSRVTEGQPVRAALGIWCLAGLRQMEAAHLRTDIDVVLDGPRPVIKVQRREGEFPWKAKTDRSMRDVPICGELLEILREHVRLGFAGERYFLHPPREDRPYRPVALRRLARSAFVAAGIKYGSTGDGLTTHSLRHTFASWLAQQNVSVLVIAKLIGDTVEQVVSTYAHLVPENLDEAIGVLDRVARKPEVKATSDEIHNSNGKPLGITP